MQEQTNTTDRSSVSRPTANGFEPSASGQTSYSNNQNRTDINRHANLESHAINKTLLVLLVVTLVLSLNFLGLVLGDIKAGVISGEPETGWGILLAIFFIGPLLFVFGLLTLFKIKNMKSTNQKIGKTVKLAGVIVLGLSLAVVLYSVILSVFMS